MGIWQSVMCLRVWPALSATAPLPRGQEPQRMPQGASRDWVEFEDSVMREGIAIENIYRFFRIVLARRPGIEFAIRSPFWAELCSATDII